MTVPGTGVALKFKEAAKLLGISVRHLSNLVKRGEVPSVKLGRRRVFYRDVLNEWLRDRVRSGTETA